MYIIESLIFAILTAYVNCAFYPLSIWFTGATANPYQILCLLMSIKYGSVRGVISSLTICSSAAGVIYALNPGLLSKAFEAESVYFWLTVLMVSNIAGHLRDIQKNEIDDVEKSRQKALDELASYRQDHTMLSKANRELTKKIVTRFHSLSSVYEATQKLETLNREKLFPAILELLRDHLGVKTAYIYSFDGTFLGPEASITESKSQSGPFEEFAAIKDAMVLECIQTKKTVSLIENIFNANSSLNEKYNLKHLIVTPVFLNSKISHVIIVDDIAFESFSDSAVRMINIIAEWIELCLNKIERFNVIESEVPIDRCINCYKPEFLKQAIKLETVRAVRYKLPLTICKLSIANNSDISPNMKSLVYLTIGYIIKNIIRDVDIHGAYIDDGFFTIILPVTHLKGANILVEKVVAKIDDFKIRPYIKNDDEVKIEAESYSLFDHIVSENTLRMLPYEMIDAESEKVYNLVLEKLKF